ALLATSVVVGCGAAQHPGQATLTVASTAARPADHTSRSSRAAAIPPPSSTRLAATAFTSPAAGYGIFTGRAGGRGQALAGRTTDGGARFGPLVRVTAWRCDAYAPASALTADTHDDAFFYDPGLFITHDGGRTWANGHQPGVVMAIAIAGRSVWMLRADCPHHGGTCPLRLLESENGGRARAPSPGPPPRPPLRPPRGHPPREAPARP